MQLPFIQLRRKWPPSGAGGGCPHRGHHSGGAGPVQQAARQVRGRRRTPSAAASASPAVRRSCSGAQGVPWPSPRPAVPDPAGTRSSCGTCAASTPAWWGCCRPTHSSGKAGGRLAPASALNRSPKSLGPGSAACEPDPVRCHAQRRSLAPPPSQQHRRAPDLHKPSGQQPPHHSGQHAVRRLHQVCVCWGSGGHRCKLSCSDFLGQGVAALLQPGELTPLPTLFKVTTACRPCILAGTTSWRCLAARLRRAWRRWRCVRRRAASPRRAGCPRPTSAAGAPQVGPGRQPRPARALARSCR